MSGTAVLLIVGAAVIGPIQPKLLDPPYDTRAECFAIHGGATHVFKGDQSWDVTTYCYRVYGYTSETVEQTCARAIKETGLDDARCVPAPSGLKP